MKQTQTFGWTWGFVPVLTGAVICWIILFWAMGRGYDFTDDANSLIWDSNPFIYDWSVTEFGFFWNPIYRLVGGDIKLFRLAGAAVLSGSAAIFGSALWRFVAPRLRPMDCPTFILAIATASLWQFAFWIPTPGYNQLNLCGLLLFSAGLVFATPAIGRSSSENAGKLASVATAALAAFGWCIVAFTKPTTAVAGCFIGVAWLLFLRPQRPLLFILSAALFSGGFVVIGMLAIDGDIQRFIQREITATHLMGIHSPTHGVSAIWHSLIDPLFNITPHLLRISIILGISTWWLSVLLQTDGRRVWAANLLTLAVPAALAVTVGIWHGGGVLRNSYYTSLMVPGLLLIALGLALAFNRERPETNWRAVAMSGLLALLPASYALGTNASLVDTASLASVFLLSAFIVLATTVAADRRERIFAAAAATASVLTVGMLIGAIATPYRIPSPLWSQTERVEIGAFSSPLLVQKPTAEYITALQRAAAANGFGFGTPIIDLTGAAPGTVFALGGEAPGMPWLSGGYPGSPEYVREALSRIPHEHLRDAWVLTGPGANEALPESILQSLGLNFPQAYRMVGRACFGVTCVEHSFWKPKNGTAQ